MADFAAVLRKTLDRIDQPSPEMRANVYQKARDAIARQIDAMETRPPQAAIDKQYAKLEDAIAEVEAGYAPAPEDLEPEPLVEEPVVEEVIPEPEPEAEPEPEIEPEPEPEPEPDPEPEDSLSDPVLPPEVEPDPVASVPDEENPPEIEPLDNTLGTLDEARDEPVFDTAEATDSREPEELHPAVTPQDDPVAEALAQYDDADAIAEEVAAEPDTEIERDPLLDFLNEQSAANERDRLAADEPVLTADDREPVFGGGPDVTTGEETVRAEPIAAPVRSGGGGKAIIWFLLLALIGGAAYASYANRDALTSWFGSATSGGDDVATDDVGVPVRTVPSTTVTADDTATEEAPAEPGEEQAALETETAVESEAGVDKFTQRLTEDGSEIDEGPVEGASTETEGSSVFAQNGQADGAEIQDGAAPDAGQTTEQAAVPIGQRAIFYEERTGDQAGTALAGTVLWSVSQEAPEAGAEPEPAIRAEASVPDLGLVMELTIKRNADETLPASHLVEIFFRVPDTFAGRGIADVQRITLKEAESDAGNALIAVPAPLDTNIFLIALTDADTAIESNLQLLENQNWIDIPMQYISGRRALITLEKGVTGDRVFQEVINAWRGQSGAAQ